MFNSWQLVPQELFIREAQYKQIMQSYLPSPEAAIRDVL